MSFPDNAPIRWQELWPHCRSPAQEPGEMCTSGPTSYCPATATRPGSARQSGSPLPSSWQGPLDSVLAFYHRSLVPCTLVHVLGMFREHFWWGIRSLLHLSFYLRFPTLLSARALKEARTNHRCHYCVAKHTNPTGGDPAHTV